MKNLLIAATVVGAAAAGVILYMRNRDRADEALANVKDAAKNAYRKMDKMAKKASKRAGQAIHESANHVESMA